MYMRNLFFIISLLIVFSCSSVFAGAINQSVYKTMTGTSYRDNYRLNTRGYRPTPYWQTQANPATRDSSGFMNYDTQQYNQEMNQYKYNMKLMRGY